MTEKKQGFWENVRERLSGKTSLEDQMEPYGIVVKRSSDSERAEDAATIIMEQLAIEPEEDSPSKMLTELHSHAVSAIGVLDSKILNMLRLADREALKPRINLFHRISEERLSETLELAYYLEAEMAEASKITDKELRKAKIAFIKNKARIWNFTLRELLHKKVRDLTVEAWGKLDKTGVIHYEAQIPIIPKLMDGGIGGVTGSGGRTSEDQVRKPRGGPYNEKIKNEV